MARLAALPAHIRHTIPRQSESACERASDSLRKLEARGGIEPPLMALQSHLGSLSHFFADVVI